MIQPPRNVVEYFFLRTDLANVLDDVAEFIRESDEELIHIAVDVGGCIVRVYCKATDTVSVEGKK